MNILVLIAGVHDPKWPITPAGALGDAAEHRIMSPFDEAALEMALRLRDAQPSASISARVLGTTAAARIARAVAALNISDVATFTAEFPWDQSVLARTLEPLCDGADLILIGREFGDFDDGLVPALLAELLSVPYFGRAQTIDARGGLFAMREVGPNCEKVALSGRILISATNDRRTRLRKPLMKNVMMARKVDISEIAVRGGAPSTVALHGLSPCSTDRGRTDCAILPGTIGDQVQALATLLWQARA